MEINASISLCSCRTLKNVKSHKVFSDFDFFWKQESRAVAGNIPRDAAVNFDTQCLETIDRSAASAAGS